MADKPVLSSKTEAVDKLATQFTDANASVITDYRGLSVSQLTQLRRTLGAQTSYRVTKNTLARRAAEKAGMESMMDLFEGPTAIAFVGGDPVEAAKGLRDFARSNPGLEIKGAMMDGALLPASHIEKLADLEPREVLLAKMAGAMKGSMTKAAGLFAAPASQVARLAAALQDKKQAEQAA